ncbi:MAG: trehalase, partial [Flavobacteriales bacterium CG_4_9_14_0_2_um_filter_35_242]
MPYNYFIKPLKKMQLKVNIKTTLNNLLNQEDTDGDSKITIEDKGPKLFIIKDTQTLKTFTVKGTYHLSNLLQELVLAQERNCESVIINTDNITQKPVERFTNMIKNHYWDGLTRRIDIENLKTILFDEKSASSVHRIYVPYTDAKAYRYFKEIETSSLKVIKLPKTISPNYVNSLNDKPGILSLKLEEKNGVVSGVPFVVPGGRFNEMYGWDSYFESIGLLLSDKALLAKAMADNFQYEIE